MLRHSKANYAQQHLGNQIRKYINIQRINEPSKYQDEDLKPLFDALQKGTCNGFVGLWIYHVLKMKEETFFEQLNALSLWDGEAQSLKSDPALSTLLESFINHIIWIQKDFKLLLEGYTQPDLHHHLNFLTGENSIQRHLKLGMVLVESELNYVLSKIQRSNLPLVIRCEDHVVAAYRTQEGYQYYDSRNPKGVISIKDSESLSNTLRSELFIKNLKMHPNMHLIIDVYSLLDTNVNLPNPAEIAKDLYQSRSVIALKTSLGITSAHMAVTADNPQLLQTIIESKQSVIDPDNNGVTPLHLAAMYGLVDCMELLTPYYSNLDLKDRNLNTPLHYAIAHKRFNLAISLIKLGANIYKENTGGLSPLKLAFMNDDEVFIKALYNENILDLKELNKLKMLFFAIKNNSKRVVKLLLSLKADVNIQNVLGSTPLHEIIKTKDEELIQELLKLNPNLGLSDISKRNPIHLAAENNILSVIDLAQGSGAINAKDSNGNTPLHYAIQANQTEAVIALLKGGADLDAQNHAQETPLQLARKMDFKPILSLLVRVNVTADLHTTASNNNSDHSPKTRNKFKF